MPMLGSSSNSSELPLDVKAKKNSWNRKNPFSAVLSTNKLLSKSGSGKEIRHFEVDISDSGIQYEAGDVINIIPVNAPDLVQSIITRLGVKSSFIPENKNQSIESLFTSSYEISTPSKNLVAYIEDKIGDKELTSVVKSANKDMLSAVSYTHLTLPTIDPV